MREAIPAQVQWNSPVVIGGEKCGVYQYSCAGGPESNIKYIEGIGITANGCLPLFEPEFTPSIFNDSYDYPWRHSILNAVYDSSGEKIYDYVGYGSKTLLKVGKVWVWKGRALDEEVPVYYTVTGTEEIDGKSCFRVDQTSDIPELSGGIWLLYEEGGKVSVRYVDPDDNVSWLPLYDFSMTTGEEHQISIVNESGLYDPQSDNRWKVTGEKNVYVSGVTRRMMSLSTTESLHKTVWVEGVGAPYLDGQLTWFWFPEPDNGIYLIGFKECIEDGEVIFSFADFGDPASVRGVGDDSSVGLNEDTIYDVMGRRVDATVPGSVYIRGGKKFVAR